MSILDDHPWRTLSGDSIDDIREHIKKYATPQFTLHVGTDTKPNKLYTTLITTICFREQGKGAVVAYQKAKIQVFPTIRDRLFHETFISLEVARAITDIAGRTPTIHADENPHQDAVSSQVVDVVVGMIKGMGYPVLVKPEAWAADIADMYTR